MDTIDVTPAQFVLRILIALLGGMLIGLERERAQISASARTGRSMPGMRSFGLLSLYGALVSYSASIYTGDSRVVILLSGSAGILLLLLVYAYARMIRTGILGITTYIVMLVTYALGVIAGAGLILESAAVSVLVTLTLALKYPAERAAAEIKYSELLAIIEVGALALILGPMVKAASDSLGISLIYKTYIFFLIILTISLTSYLTARAWGARGIIYAAILGAIVNSEATIASVARQVMGLPERLRPLMAGVLAPLIIVVAQAKLVVLALLGFLIFTGTIPVETAYYLALALLYLLAVARILQAKLAGLPRGLLERAPIEIRSPLNWGGAAKSALAYAIMAALFLALNRTPLGGYTAAPLLLSFLGGLVSATAVILGLGTAIGQMSPCIATASALIVLVSVSLNKILYVRTGGVPGEIVGIITRWSILLSIPPLALVAVSLAYC